MVVRGGAIQLYTHKKTVLDKTQINIYNYFGTDKQFPLLQFRFKMCVRSKSVLRPLYLTACSGNTQSCLMFLLVHISSRMQYIKLY